MLFHNQNGAVFKNTSLIYKLIDLKLEKSKEDIEI